MNEDIQKVLTKEKNNIQSLLKLVTSIKKYEKDPVNNLGKIKQNIVKISKILEQEDINTFIEDKLHNFIQALTPKITEWEEEARKRFGRKLEEELGRLGLEISGHYPLLRVSLYTLEVDIANLKVSIWYGPQQEKLDTLDLIAQKVAKRLENIRKEIELREFDDDDFLAKLYEAYRISLVSSGKAEGYQVPISEILFKYALLIQPKKFRVNPTKNNYKGYSRIFFSYDLFRLNKRELDGTKLVLITATRAYTKRREDFIWVPCNRSGEGSCISHIKFVEA